MLISRETHLPLFPDNRQGNCSWTERHTHSTHTASSDPRGHMEKATLQPPSCPTHRRASAYTDLLPPSVDSGPSRARLPPLPSVLQGSSGCRCPTVPGHLGCCALCCVRSVQHTARMAARPPAPSEGLLCASCLQRKKTVFAAEQHSLEPSIAQWTPKATSTRMPHPTTQNACLQKLATSTCLNKAHRDVGPLLATLHHHRLLWKLLVPHSLWKWTYCFL